MEEKNKKVIVPTIVAVVTLVLLTVGATYAYFRVATDNAFGTSKIEASTPSIGSVALSTGSNLTMNLTAEEMMEEDADIVYYASPSGTTTDVHTENIGTATVTGSGSYTCTYKLTIDDNENSLYDKFQTEYANKSTGQVVLTVNGVTYDFNTAGLFPKEIEGTMSGITSNSPQYITAQLKLVNSKTIDQSNLSGQNITLTFGVENFSCTAIEPVNLFSFEKADEHFASLAPSYASSNYIIKTSEEYGYKDVENGYFVFNSSPSGRHGITGAMEPLSAGSYKLTAEVYIPSGNTDKTKVKFEASSYPDVLDQGNVYDIKEQDKWVKLETTFVVKEGNIAYVSPAKSYISTYPVYTRNIKVTEIAPTSNLDLRGYKWEAIGDSLTQKSSYALLNYYDYVSFNTGIYVTNMGTGGAGYKAYESSNAAFYQKALKISADADVVTIFGSGNDLSDSIWNTYGLGNPSDTGTDTICGSINTAIDNIYATNPDVKLGIILPTPWGKYNETLETDPGNRMTLYTQALIEICESRNIPYLDLYTNSVLKPWDSEMVEIAFNTSAATHPNEYGHSLIAPKIQEFVINLLAE